jgi:putative tryptophan/tyrosine transport system substrate-binding protein
MKRRAFIASVGAMAALPSLRATAQTVGRIYRIGSLHSAPVTAPHHVVFFDELARAGFVLGKNLERDPTGYGLRQEQFAAHVAELVDARIDVILCAGDLAIQKAQRLTTTIPILGVTEDMLSSGFVGSLSRPDRNTTGVSILAAKLDGKRQEILLEMIPSLRRIALLVDKNNLSTSHIVELEASARKAGVTLSIHRAGRVEEIPDAIQEAKSGDPSVALNVLATPLFFNNRALIFAKVAEIGLPAIYEWPEMAEAGGLAAYGPRIFDIYRTQVSRQMTKILRGVPIAEIPVEQPTAFELVINLKTARSAGFDLAPVVIARADKVIE